jgi:arginyl-tRNA synthetase
MEEKIILFIKAEIKKLYNLEIEDISLNEVPKNKFGDLSFNC